MLRQALIALLLICPAAHAEKSHAWMTGTTLDTARNRYFAGTINNGYSTGTLSGNADTYGNTTSVAGNYSGTSSGTNMAIYRVFENYVIDAGDTVYMAQERLRFRWSHPAHLIVNAPVQFYVDGRHIHIRDEDGKEHEAEILKQVRKTGPQ